MARSGPAEGFTVINAESGIISPALLRTLSSPTSSGRERNGASACTRTEYVRPKRLKSFAYTLPRYTCIVSNTSVTGTPSWRALVRSMSA